MVKVWPNGRQMFNARVDPEIVKEFKVQCAKDGRFMWWTLTELMKKYIRGEIKL